MIDLATVYTNVTGAFPDVTAQNATGAGLTDGTEFIKAGLDNGPEFGFMQSIMAYAAGGVNAPTGTVGVPNGVSDGEGVNQIIQAIEKGFAVGPGKYVQWGLFDDPSVTLDRVLLLSNQGVLIATYPDLVTETYVGDGNNATAPFFYKATDAGGGTRSTVGSHFILPPSNPSYQRQYSEADGDFTVSVANWTTVRAVATPYQTSDGAWRLNFNVTGTTTAGSTSAISLVFSGVTSINARQTFSTSQDSSGSVRSSQGFIDASTNIFIVQHDTITTVQYTIAGDIELSSKPTWADDFEFPWGITY